MLSRLRPALLALGGLFLSLPMLAGPGWGSLEGLRLGSARQSSQTLTFSIGHLRLDFQGTWTPCLQGEKAVGLYLEGRGMVEYLSSYAPEGPVFERNMKDWLGRTPTSEGGGRKAGLTFQRARLLLSGGEGPAWEGTPAAAAPEAFAAFGSRWEKVDGHAPAHLLALQSANAPGRPVAILEMEDGDLRYLYRFDAVDAFEETLEVLPLIRGIKTGEVWSERLALSRQPLGWDPKAGQAVTRFQLTALDADLRTSDNRNAILKVQETLVPLQDGLSVLPFELVSIVLTERDTRRVRMTRITDASGRALEFAHDHDHLVVRLPAAAPKGVPLTLTFEYEGDFLLQPGEDSYWQLGVRGAWYPQPRHFSEESYLFHGTVRTKGDWIAFLPGDTVRRNKDGEWNLVETRTEKPICFATILGGKYHLEEETRNGLTVRIASYAFKPGVATRVIKDQAFNILGYYQQFLGPYPFKELVIVEKNQWGYGQAPPGMMYITREAFEQISHLVQQQEMVDQASQFGGGRIDFRTMDVRHVMAHELAHQYWGTVVKMPTAEDQWITESFAEYTAALFLRDYKGQGAYEKHVARWKPAAKEAADAAPIPLANDIRRKDGWEGFRMRTGLLYDKGPMLLYALHQDLGDKTFFTWLKSIQSNFRWKHATTWRLFDLLGYITKKDQKPFYEAYFWGLEMPPSKQ